jgi:prepilin-type N-terminal cleavage/methylation domain-containing protein
MQLPNTYNLSSCQTPSVGHVKHSVFDRLRGGFTLIEILITIAIFSALLSLGLFMSMDAYRGFSFRSEQGTIVSVLEKARSRALNNLRQTPWGVCYSAPNYVMFSGASCTTAGSDLIPANAGVAASSNFAGTFPTIVFSQLAATTSGATITVTQNGRTSAININHEGTIIW